MLDDVTYTLYLTSICNNAIAYIYTYILISYLREPKGYDNYIRDVLTRHAMIIEALRKTLSPFGRCLSMYLAYRHSSFFIALGKRIFSAERRVAFFYCSYQLTAHAHTVNRNCRKIVNFGTSNYSFDLLPFTHPYQYIAHCSPYSWPNYALLSHLCYKKRENAPSLSRERPFPRTQRTFFVGRRTEIEKPHKNLGDFKK